MRDYQWQLEVVVPDKAQKGGPGSGHWGHAGRPGKRGGSVPGRGGQWASGGTRRRMIASWYRAPAHDERLMGELARAGQGDASVMAHEYGYGAEWDRFNRDVQRWTSGADASAKADIAEWLRFPQIRTLSLYEDWSASGTDSSFDEWMRMPQVLYRGGGTSHPFMSFARSSRVARDASGGEDVWSLEAAPKDWLGSGMTGAGEVWIEPEALE